MCCYIFKTIYTPEKSSSNNLIQLFFNKKKPDKLQKVEKIRLIETTSVVYK